MASEGTDRVYLPAVVYMGDGEYWLLQYSNGEEGIVLNGGAPLVAPTFESLARAGEERGITVDEADAMPVELDVVERWLARPTTDTVDPAIFLDAWDLGADLARSLGDASWPSDAAAERAYEKLFWGSTAMGAEDEGGTAVTWTGPQAVRLRQVMRRVVESFRGTVVDNPEQ